MRRIITAFAVAFALLAPALYVAAQTPIPPPGKIGDITYNNVTIQEGLTLQVAINYGVDAGSTDAYVATITPAPTAYVTGGIYILKAATANTGAATVNFNSLGAKTIVKAVSTALADNDIVANMFCLLVYNGTNMVLLNPRVL